MRKKTEKAFELFEKGFNCSQAVCGAFSGQFEIEEESLMKLAGGFGGGLQLGEVCGAVTGAVLIIGLKFGQSTAKDKASKEKCNAVTKEFMEAYQKERGSVLCRELLRDDILEAMPGATFLEKKKEVCLKAIETALLLLVERGF